MQQEPNEIHYLEQRTICLQRGPTAPPSVEVAPFVVEADFM
jgi:hypothetical protein